MNKYFLEKPANTKLFVLQEEDPTMFPFRFSSEGLKNYWFGLAGTCKMETEIYLHATYKRPCILIRLCSSE